MKKKERAPDHAVVLVTITHSDAPSQGTGVVVAAEGNARWVLTCEHVIGAITDAQYFRVNGHAVMEVRRATEKFGLDLALLKVADLAVEPAAIGSFAVDSPINDAEYYGYSRLFRSDYLRECIQIDVGEELVLQNSSARSGVYAHRFTTRSRSVEPGHSGSPVFNDKKKVSALVVYRLSAPSAKGKSEGLAISLGFASRHWPDLGQLLGITAASSFAQGVDVSASSRTEQGPVPLVPLPPPPPDLYRVGASPDDDLIAGKFGGLSNRDGYVFSGRLHRESLSKNFFAFDLVLTPPPGERPVSAVRFFLHHTFDPPSFIVHKPDEEGKYVLRELLSYGVFAAGCQFCDAPDSEMLLEYNVASLPGLPEHFTRR